MAVFAIWKYWFTIRSQCVQFSHSLQHQRDVLVGMATVTLTHPFTVLLPAMDVTHHYLLVPRTGVNLIWGFPHTAHMLGMSHSKSSLLRSYAEQVKKYILSELILSYLTLSYLNYCYFHGHFCYLWKDLQGTTSWHTVTQTICWGVNETPGVYHWGWWYNDWEVRMTAGEQVYVRVKGLGPTGMQVWKWECGCREDNNEQELRQ